MKTRICLILLACFMVMPIFATQFDQYLLPVYRFRDWNMLENKVSDAGINQQWKKNLPDTSPHNDGYLLVAYNVISAATREEATAQAAILMQKAQYNNYLAQGFTVESEGWSLKGLPAVIFIISGLTHNSMADTRAQLARIYTLAYAYEECVVLLQVREVSYASDLKKCQKLLKNVGGRNLTEELAAELIQKWYYTTTNDDLDDPILPPKITPPVDDNKDPVIDGTADQPTDDVVPIEPLPVAKLEGKLWETPDHYLSLIVPDKWKVSGKLPYSIAGEIGSRLLFYPYDEYRDEEQLAAKLQSFVRSQHEISVDGYAEGEINIDGAIGKQVRYQNVAGQQIYANYIAKSGRLWRIDVIIDQPAAELPEIIKAMLSTVKIK